MLSVLSADRDRHKRNDFKLARESTASATTFAMYADKSKNCSEDYDSVGDDSLPHSDPVTQLTIVEGIDDILQDSYIFTSCISSDAISYRYPDDLRFFNKNDFVVGIKLGEGAFSNVMACSASMSEQKNCYAIKYLKQEINFDVTRIVSNTIDLVKESFFLHTISHPNVIRLHGVILKSFDIFPTDRNEISYAIVVDRLEVTLDQCIDEWKLENEHQMNFTHWWFTLKHRKTMKKQLNKRLDIGLSVAKALEYLHSRNIIFRDLKPQNIGFDKFGVLKLFDFGLAKELKNKDKLEDGRYCLTGSIGTLRYVSPEVAQNLPYNQSTDVYSFGILLWELCTAENPYDGIRSHDILRKVITSKLRPNTKRILLFSSLKLTSLMRQCWSHYAEKRPDFTAIIQKLYACINAYQI